MFWVNARVKGRNVLSERESKGPKCSEWTLGQRAETFWLRCGMRRKKGNVTEIWYIIEYSKIRRGRRVFTSNNYHNKIVGYTEIVLFNMNGMFLCSCARWRKATISFVMSVCLPISQSAQKALAHNGRIFTKFGIWSFSKNLSVKLNFH